MPRFILILSFLPILLALAARWWFGQRVLVREGGRSCRVDLGRWKPHAEAAAAVEREEGSAHDFGWRLRRSALAEWRERDPRAASRRESARRFGMAVPPLSVVVSAFAVLVGKLTVMGAFAMIFAATAFAAFYGMLALGRELSAIAASAGELRATRAFRRSDDESAVIRCATAHAWNEALPPVLRWLVK